MPQIQQQKFAIFNEIGNRLAPNGAFLPGRVRLLEEHGKIIVQSYYPTSQHPVELLWAGQVEVSVLSCQKILGERRPSKRVVTNADRETIA